MAVITAVVVDLSNFQDKGQTYSWTPLTFTGLDSGAPAGNFSGADRSVQVEGTFGAGGNVVIEGSNDGVNYETLNDHLGNALNITAKGIKSVDQICRYVRPRVTAGDGTTSLTITMLTRRIQP